MSNIHRIAATQGTIKGRHRGFLWEFSVVPYIFPNGNPCPLVISEMVTVAHMNPHINPCGSPFNLLPHSQLSVVGTVEAQAVANIVDFSYDHGMGDLKMTWVKNLKP